MADNTFVEKMKLADGKSYNVGLRNIYINEKGNFNIETSTDLGNTSKGKINIESMNDIQFKPGDDIGFESHHRDAGKQDEISMKMTNGDDRPVKLQVNLANLVLTTKNKDLRETYPDISKTNEPTSSSSDDEILDMYINTGKSTGNKRGYLKLRARAIDLRCEEHGGIAIQPMGRDSSGNMNKIKFEHGGGDGLEFGTFNTEKTSLFTDEYRFNRDGIVKVATRKKETSDKRKEGNDTTYYKYVKNTKDDFYDFISDEDPVADWKSIVKTGNAFNYGKNRHAKLTNKGNLEIETCAEYFWTSGILSSDTIDLPSIEEFPYQEAGMYFNEGDVDDLFELKVGSTYRSSDSSIFTLEKNDSPSIKLVSGDSIELESDGKTTITSGKSMEIVSDKSIEIRSANSAEIDILTPRLSFQHKMSKKGAEQGDNTKLSYTIVNNYTSEFDGVEPGLTKTYSVDIKDVIKAVQYIKKNNIDFNGFQLEEEIIL